MTPFILLFLAPPSEAADPSGYPVYIKKFELKNNTGQWITVIEPDRTVDLAEEEAKVSFFNTAGRVPEGHYSNFRLTLEEAGSRKTIRITRKWDFPETFAVKKGSFIYALAAPVVQKKPVPALKEIQESKITVDDRSIVMGREEILIE